MMPEIRWPEISKLIKRITKRRNTLISYRLEASVFAGFHVGIMLRWWRLVCLVPLNY